MALTTNFKVSFPEEYDLNVMITRLDHGSDVLDVDDVGEVARFVQVVEPAHFDGLSDDLVGDLVAPLVNVRHVDVVDEDRHPLAGRRPVRAAHALVQVALHDPLRVLTN